MEESSNNPPASVATELIKDHIPIAPRPPMPARANSCFVRSTSRPLTTDDEELQDVFLAAAEAATATTANTTQDDIDAHHHRKTMPVISGNDNLFISESTRRVLEKMDDNQVKNARKAFVAVKMQRMKSQRMLGDSGINVKETLGEIGRQSSKRIVCEDSQDDGDVSGDDAEKRRSSLPTSARRQSRRRNGLKTRSMITTGSQVQTSTWKPLSSNQQDDDKEEEEKEEVDTTKNTTAGKQGRGGIGNLWNKLTSSFSEPSNNKQAAQAQLSPKKEIDGATYFRRGKKKANKCQFLPAVVLFNFALVQQREELGENHIDCGTTLNEIGVCWMMLGEQYPAMTAFEEALYIRQEGLGVGAMEVAETTNNIWMILHEAQCEMENSMEEAEGEEEED